MRRGIPTKLVVGASLSVLRVVKRPLWSVVHSLTGRRLQLPLGIYDLSMYGAAFEANAEAAQKRMPSHDLHVVEHAPGKTEIHILAFDHRAPDVLVPYREMAICVPVQRLGERGVVFLHLPVTTEDARWGGVDNYGFPKFVADVRIGHGDGAMRCTLHADGVHVLTLEVNELMPASGHLSFKNFTLRGDDQIVESILDIDGQVARSEAAGGAHLSLGPHAIAAGLRELGIETRSRSHWFVAQARARLSVGRAVGQPTPSRAAGWCDPVERRAVDVPSERPPVDAQATGMP